jgi:hypothetical protein
MACSASGPRNDFANYDEVVDEMRLAEGLLDRGGIRAGCSHGAPSS